MANFCTQFISFSNKLATFELVGLYQNAENNPMIEGQYINPSDDNAIFDIILYEDNISDPYAFKKSLNVYNGEKEEHYIMEIMFSSKWEPMFNELVKLANKHFSDFVMEYEELGEVIFGKAKYDYESGTLEIIELPRDFKDTHLEYNEDGELRLIGTEDYNESESELLGSLIDEFGVREVKIYPKI